jgi:hypothetical protein
MGRGGGKGRPQRILDELARGRITYRDLGRRVAVPHSDADRRLEELRRELVDWLAQRNEPRPRED